MATHDSPRNRNATATSKKPDASKYVYFFGGGKADGNGKMKDELGGKGAGLAEMTNAGLPVPPGFTIQTEACREYMRHGGVSAEVDRQMEEALRSSKQLQGQKLGKGENPLLVSVRSGAKFSMPGMMDTILNLGLNDQSVEALAKRSNNPRFAYDSYRRLIQMFGNVVLEIPKPAFDEVFDAKKKQKKAKLDTDLDAKALKEVIAEYKKVVKKHTKRDFPQDPHEQLVMARDAVFRSWQNDRAKHYRRINNIYDDAGHSSQCAGHGLRQPRRDQRHGRRLHAQSRNRHQRVLRRIPDECAGRRCSRGHSARRFPSSNCKSHAGCLRPTARDHDSAGKTLSRHAGFRVHHPGWQALHAADSQRQAHRPRRRTGGDPDGGRGTDHKEEAIFRVEPNQLYDFLVPRLGREEREG